MAAIVAGIPGAGAMEIVKACKNKGLTVAPFSVTKAQANEKLPDKVNIPDVGDVNIVSSDAEDAKSKLEATVKDLKDKGLVPVAIDAQANVSNANLYNSLSVPFVSPGSGDNAAEDTTAMKNSAMIGPYLSRELMAFDDMLSIFSKRHRGLFNNSSLAVLDDVYTPSILLNRPLFHRSMFDSFERLFDEDFFPDAIVKQDGEYVSGHAMTTYTVKDKATGSTVFEFKHALNDKPVAEAVADAAQFLGDRVATQSTERLPRVWPMTALLDSW